MYSASQPENVLPWASIIEHLGNMETVCFDYTLQVLDTDDTDFEYEYDVPPLALVDDVKVSTENDVTIFDHAWNPNLQRGNNQFGGHRGISFHVYLQTWSSTSHYGKTCSVSS